MIMKRISTAWVVLLLLAVASIGFRHSTLALSEIALELEDNSSAQGKFKCCCLKDSALTYERKVWCLRFAMFDYVTSIISDDGWELEKTNILKWRCLNPNETFTVSTGTSRRTITCGEQCDPDPSFHNGTSSSRCPTGVAEPLCPKGKQSYMLRWGVGQCFNTDNMEIVDSTNPLLTKLGHTKFACPSGTTGKSVNMQKCKCNPECRHTLDWRNVSAIPRAAL